MSRGFTITAAEGAQKGNLTQNQDTISEKISCISVITGVISLKRIGK